MKIFKQLTLIIFFFTGLYSRAVTLELTQENMSLEASNATLGEVLEAFARQGVKVTWDPMTNIEIDARIVDQPVDRTLKKLLGPFSYSLTWLPIDTPYGQWLKLDEMTVFRPGHWHQAQAAFTDTGTDEDIVWLPDGSGYVKNEMLIGLKPGTRMSDLVELLKGICANIVSANKKFGIYRIRFCEGKDMESVVSTLEASPHIAISERNYALKALEPSRVDRPKPSSDTKKKNPPTSVAPNSPTIAVLDTGLSPSISLGEAFQSGYDATRPGSSLNDSVGHGSQMALTASGLVTPEGGLASDNANPVIAIKAFDDQGRATSFGLMNAMEYAIDQGAGIISMSWGTTADSSMIRNAISYAHNEGAILVAAAGNDGAENAMYPANYDQVIAVGATNPDGSIWEKSNRGNVDVTAPGYASFPIGNRGPPGSYHGTSTATQYISNLIASYKREHPDVSNKAILQRLEDSATDEGPAGYDTVYGHGNMDSDASRRFLYGK